MKRLLTSRAASAAVVGVVTALAAGGGYAIASGSGTIHACVHKGTHILYTGKCQKGDKKLSWNKQGVAGTNGTNGTNGSALAYAHVFSAGAVDTGNAKNIAAANVSHPANGVYCISGLGFAPHNVVATVDWNNGGGVPTITATLGIGGGSGCPAGTQVTIGTGDSSSLASRAFFVALN
jgi:hypothetical protein